MRRRPALLAFSGLIGVIVAVAVSAGLRHTSASGGSLTQRRQAVLAYSAALEPLAKEGGQVVVLGLKPGIADIEKHSLPGPTLEQMALGWTHELTTVSGKLHAVVVPSYLAAVKTGYDESLTLYVDTAQTVLDATRVDGAQRAALVARAVSLGQQADARFDRANAALDVLRSEVGLTAVSTKK